MATTLPLLANSIPTKPVTVVLPTSDKGKQFVFDKSKKLKEWLKDNLAPTGEVERFSDALDNDPKNDTIDANYSTGIFYAKYKFYLDAKPSIRAKRRYQELQAKGIAIDYSNVSVLYAGARNCIYKTEDSANSWNEVFEYDSLA